MLSYGFIVNILLVVKNTIALTAGALETFKYNQKLARRRSENSIYSDGVED